jgi:voltage-gated potassium channel
MNFGAVELEHPRLARLEQALDTLVVVAAIATVPLLIADDVGIDPTLVSALDWIVWSVFAGEYLLLIALSPDRLTFARRNWLAAGVVVLSFPGWPAAFELARLARLGRVLRVLWVTWRAFATLRAVFGRRELVEIAALAGAVVLAGGAMLTFVEPDTVKGDFWTAVWWSLVTATTVGYGDVTPTTMVGRATAVVVMVVGIGTMSTLIAAISGHFAQQDRADEMRDIKEQLTRIEARLDRLMAERERD